MRRTTDDHGNAHFNMIDRALHGPDPRRDAATRDLLDAWLKRPRADFYVDLHGKVKTCGSDACDPVPVDLRPPSDFVWQISPFQIVGGGAHATLKVRLNRESRRLADRHGRLEVLARSSTAVPGAAAQSSRRLTLALRRIDQGRQ